MDIREFTRKIPKVELHRHLSGAVQSETMFNLAKKAGIDTEVPDLESFKKLTSMYGTDKGFQTFLSKFKPRSRFYSDRKLITEVTRSVMEDIASDNIMHVDLRFSASHFSRHMDFELEDVSEQIISTASDEADN